MNSKELIALLPLLSELTVRQVIEAGDEVIDAAGLNPYCMKEGLADGTEQAVGRWKIDLAAAHIAAQDARIEALEGALRNIQIEAERPTGHWQHLKRVIGLNAKTALGGEQHGG